MATSPLRLQQGYGIGNALQPLPPFSIIANRAPTQQDKARIGTFWVYTALNNVYVLTSVTGGVSNWLTLSNGGAGVFLSLTVNGPSTFAGNITQTAGVTSLLATTTAGLTNNGVFTNNGNTGINGQLDITENVADAVIVTNSNRGGGSRHLLCTQSSVDANAVQFTIVKNRAGAVVDPADSLFQQNIIAQGVTGLTTSGRIEFTAGTPIPASTQVPSSLEILTTDTAGVLATRLNISTTGAVNLPTQPSFCVVITAASAAGVTGNGTPYTIGSAAEATPTAYTKLYESSVGIINANGQFIAPVAGRYLFTAGVRMSAYAGVTNAQIQIISPTTIIFGNETCPPAALSAFFSINTSGIINLAQGAAVSVRINCAGQGADNTVVQGDGANLFSYFTGALLN